MITVPWAAEMLEYLELLLLLWWRCLVGIPTGRLGVGSGPIVGVLAVDVLAERWP